MSLEKSSALFAKANKISQKSNIILEGFGHPHIMNNFEYSKSFPEIWLHIVWNIDGKIITMSIIWRGKSSWPKEARANDNDIPPLFRLFAEEEAAEAALYWRWLFAWVETFTYPHFVKKILVNNKYLNIHSRSNLPLPIAMPHLRLVACTLTKTRLFSHRYLVLVM